MTHYENKSMKELRAGDGMVVTKGLERQFEEVRHAIVEHRARALQVVNGEMLWAYWNVGRVVSRHIKENQWGAKVVSMLSEYLRAKDPSLKGFSRRNLYNMVMLYDAYSAESFALASDGALATVQKTSAQNASTEIVQMPSAQIPAVVSLIPYSHHIEIINRCSTDEERLFYILYAHREGLRYAELQRVIKNDAYHAFIGGDKTNFSAGMLKTYPQSVAYLKDRAIVDFLDLPQKHSERQLHNGILQNMKRFILELGKDFLFVDSEYPLKVGGSVFKVDLLFFHRGLQCLVAIELKASAFKPEYVGQLEFYLEALDRDVKRSNENPSIGILLCQSTDRSVVEYAMSRSMSPTMVAEYQRQLIPKEVLQRSLDEFCDFFGKSK